MNPPTPSTDDSVNAANAVPYCSYPSTLQYRSENVLPYTNYQGPYQHGYSSYALPTFNIYRDSSSLRQSKYRSLYQPVAPLSSQQTLPLINTTRPGCPGACLSWGPCFFTTYPFSIHEPGCKESPGYHLKTIGPDPSAIVIISKWCRGRSSEDGSACSFCATLSIGVDLVKHRTSCAGGAIKSYSELTGELREQKDEKMRQNLKVRKLRCYTIVCS